MKVMPSTTLKSVLTVTACALIGAAAAQDAFAQLPPAVAQSALEQLQAEQNAQQEALAATPHAQIFGAVHTQGAVFRPEPADPSYPLNQIGTLASCLTVAKGWMQNADLSRVHVLRAPLTDSTADIQPEIINFRNYLERGRREYNVAIYDGDTIYIPERDSSDADNVRIIREMRERPSIYYPTGPSVYIIQPQPPHYHPPRPPRPRPPIVVTPAPGQQPVIITTQQGEPQAGNQTIVVPSGQRQVQIINTAPAQAQQGQQPARPQQPRTQNPQQRPQQVRLQQTQTQQPIRQQQPATQPQQQVRPAPQTQQQPRQFRQIGPR